LPLGSTVSLRHFKAELVKISKRKVQLPGYALSLIDPRLQRLLDPRKPAPTGRTPLKSYLVHFYRTDRLSALPPVSQVPTLEELGDGLGQFPRR
jgi:hypothetical protein